MKNMTLTHWGAFFCFCGLFLTQTTQGQQPAAKSTPKATAKAVTRPAAKRTAPVAKRTAPVAKRATPTVASAPPLIETHFPATSCYDYRADMDCHVTVAYPLRPNQGRLLLHGSATHPIALVYSREGALQTTINLVAPTYTGSYETALDSVRVDFTGSGPIKSHSYWVAPVKQSTLTDTEKAFTVMVYGCFEPFKVYKPNIPSLIDGSFGLVNWRTRRLFQGIAQQQSAYCRLLVRNDEAAGYTIKQPDESGFILPPTRLVIGTGDQVYMDAGYAKDNTSNSPMIGWRDKDPKPRLSTEQFSAHVQRMYRHFASFTTLDSVFRRVPSINVWDDHEIRDGWGSQENEYANNPSEALMIKPELRPFYDAARRGYVSHQLAGGPRYVGNLEQLVSSNESLHQEFTIGKVRGFAFDLRSNRDIRKPQMMDATQWKAFDAWAAGCVPGEEVLLVSSVPLFFGRNSFLQKSENAAGGFKDDLDDSWDSKYNRSERDRLASKLVQLRKRGVRPIVLSGDVHLGAFIEIWYMPIASNTKPDSTDENMYGESTNVLAYELIASGLSHETLNATRWTTFTKNLMRHTGSERIGEDDFNVQVDGQWYRIDPQLKESYADLNFSALEFTPKAPTQLHLFISDSDPITKPEGPLWIYTGKADWEKPWSVEVKRQSVKFIKRYYTPAMLDKFRDIRVPQTPWLAKEPTSTKCVSP